MAGSENKDIQAFIARWSPSGGGERSNYQMFLAELTDLLEVGRPDPAIPENEKNDYVFDRAVDHVAADGAKTTKFIDLYKRDCFVLETKQGIEASEAKATPVAKPKKKRKGHGVRGTHQWDTSMLKARGQAESYAKDLPVDHGWPPFLAVVDVGYCIELYADFSLQGKNYTQFPDANSFRIFVGDLARDDVRERLRALWTDPLSLDPARLTAKVTREIADRLAILARSLEEDGHDPQKVAGFLMRCLFTMFAEDVGLLKPESYTELLKGLKGNAGKFHKFMEAMWSVMNKGGFSPTLGEDLMRFNGGLFAEHAAIALDEDQLELLIEAAQADWQDVEPAIFGTLLERALNKKERHKLGAHYTPRQYVERLVIPTIIEPLREDWNTVKATALAFANRGQPDKALKAVKAFHRALCETRVLDPACGTGNFLYVAMEHMKRLEGEVIDLVHELGEKQTFLDLNRHTVDPHQFLGIEINPRAAAITDLVLWIGYLQWHFRTRGKIMPVVPVLKDYGNIECRDAILAWDKKELVRDQGGKPVARWDGETMKTHPVTGKPVPDETAQIETYRYINPRPAEWPKADFIVGNPPFLGNKRMRSALGDGYVDALRAAWEPLSRNIDFVMYWWAKSADWVRQNHVHRAGLVTTNSISSVSNRVIIKQMIHDQGRAHICFAIPDHPWVDSTDGAAVRISMTVIGQGLGKGTVVSVIDRFERSQKAVKYLSRSGTINPDLSLGADITQTKVLRSNLGLSFMGVIPVGEGFRITGEAKDGVKPSRVIRRYMNGRDLASKPRDIFIIDFFGLSVTEARQKYPQLFGKVLKEVKPFRDVVKRKSHKDNWWLFGEPRPAMRRALQGLGRYIATSETARHRWFRFLTSDILPDQKIRVITLSDSYVLGVLSSRVHTVFARLAGASMGKGNDYVYNNSSCFEPYPFPRETTRSRAKIGELAEELETFRESRQVAHQDLTLTQMYNVVEKLRSGDALTDKEKEIHEKGLVSVLKDIHDQLDAAVFDAYGWPRDLADDEILERLVALNKERAEEEAGGLVRWLQPEYQAPDYVPPAQQMDMAEAGLAVPEAKAEKRPWPKALPEQVQAVREALATLDEPATAADVARAFKSARKARIQEVLETLTALGQARQVGDRFGV